MLAVACELWGRGCWKGLGEKNYKGTQGKKKQPILVMGQDFAMPLIHIFGLLADV